MRAVLVVLILIVSSIITAQVKSDEEIRKQVVNEVDLEMCREIMYNPGVLSGAADAFTVATLQKVIVIQNKKIVALTEELKNKK